MPTFARDDQELFTAEELHNHLKPYKGRGDDKLYLTLEEWQEESGWSVSYERGLSYEDAVSLVWRGREPDVWAGGNDFQGDYYVMYEVGDDIYYLCIGYGSCSG